MTEIIDIVVKNLTMVGIFLIPLAFMRAGDIFLGVNLAIKSEKIFDWKKFIKSLIQSIFVLIGIALFVTSAVILPEIMNIYKIDFINTEIIKEVLNIAFLIGIIVTSIVSYGKDCYNKILEWFNLKKENIILK